MERKKAKGLIIELSIAALIIIVLAAIAVPNFVRFQAHGGGAGFHLRNPSYPPAHGGTRPPNAAAYDAMFFESYGVNPFIDTEDDNLSTFGLDVDTASYTLSRSYIFEGNLPPKDAVRVEEFVNYMRYDYQSPEKGDFAIHLEGAPSRFGGGRHKLFRAGIKAREVESEKRKDAVLTFVIDVSGSMAREDRLGLVKRSLRILLDQLREGDRVGLVVYDSSAEVILDHTGAEDRRKIEDAIESLAPGGATNADHGLRLGYRLADQAFRRGAVNRVILCSDGVANVGETGAEGILERIKDHADRGITLTVVGFGMGNYNDVLMEKLADKGDGNYAYVDTINEARRVFLENLTGTLQVVARDARVQVDFNPAVVRSYRLLGYENRDMADKDFRKEDVDAGEIGAGHQVTALYELKFHDDAGGGRVATVHLRYDNPDAEADIREIEKSIEAGDFRRAFDEASPDFQLAAAAAEFSEILRKSYWAREGSLESVLEVSLGLPEDYRSRAEVIEFMDMVGKAGKTGETG